MRKILAYCLLSFLTLMTVGTFNCDANAVVDPRATDNNKFGIGLLSPESEFEGAGELVNSNGGDWGYIVIVVRRDERNVNRWRGLFNNFNKIHLIPIVRIATEVDEKGQWVRPSDDDAILWAEFLDNLSWPVKNRYIQVYNEVNRANEWGGQVDPGGYALELDKTISSLKSKNDNFFILNSPLDLALKTTGSSLDAFDYILEMQAAVPGIFGEIDGLASHSYPNPSFAADPRQGGRLGISGYKWELSQIEPYIGTRTLPVFITETGWARKDKENIGLDENTIANFYEQAFSGAWSDPAIVSVAPFIFNYPESPFYQFSFKRSGENSERPFFEYFYRLQALNKTRGNPEREDKLSDLFVNIKGKAIKDIPKEISIAFENRGNFVWNIQKDLTVSTNSSTVSIDNISWKNKEVYPGQQAVVNLTIKSNEVGNSSVSIEVNNGKERLGYNILEVETVNLLSYVIETFKTFI